MLSAYTLQKNHKISVLLFMYKILFGEIAIDGFKYDQFISFTRGSHYKLLLPFSKTRVRKSFALLRYIQLWNSLKPKPADLVNIAAFKRFLVDSVTESHA